jgi:hypothetical protein
MKQLTQTDRKTVDMIQFLEKKYQIQLLEGYGIHTQDMKEYQKVRLEYLQVIAQIQDEGVKI